MQTKNLKLSYILPCYNIERFVGECIDSIFNQGLSKDDFEVICVNDCTPDNTREVIVEKQKTHNNIILIDHKKNRRVGAARNTGFYAAKGDYVWFIDPDDILHSNSAKELLPILDNNKLDFIQFGHDWMTEDKQPLSSTPFNHNCTFNTDVISGIDFLKDYQKRGLSYSDMHVGCFVRIYRRQYLIDNKIIFPEVTYYEDQFQALHGLIAAKRMMNINKCFYSYRVVETSYSHVAMSVAKRASQVTMCTGMVHLMQQYGLSDNMISFVWERYDEDLKYFKTHFITFMNDEDRISFINLIKKELPLLHTLIPKSSWLMCKYPSVYLKSVGLFIKPLRLIKKIKNK